MLCVVAYYSVVSGGIPQAAHRVSGTWTRGILLSLDHLELDTKGICARARLDFEALTDPDARITRDDMMQLWRTAEELSGDPLLGLHVGELMGARDNHIVTMLAISGKTLGEGLTTGVQYQDILGDGDIVSLEREGADRLIRVHRIEDTLSSLVHVEECLVTVLYSVLDRVTLNELHAKEVRFAHSFRGGLGEYERIFHCPVFFERNHSEIVIPEASWEMGLEVWDPIVKTRLEGIAAELEQRLEAPGFIGTASRAIRALLPQGPTDVATTAKKLRVSERTLQRRLQEEGTNFRELLDATRRDIVTAAREKGLSLKDIASRAGYPTEGALQRAIRKWKGEGEL